MNITHESRHFATEIFIPGNVPALKNGKIKAKNGVFSAPSIGKYLRSLGIQSYNSRKKTVKPYVDKNRPNYFESIRKDIVNNVNRDSQTLFYFHFVRKSKHRFDFGNAVELLSDLFTSHNFIEDDSMDYFLPFPYKRDGKWYSYDKDNPGVYILIIKQ